MDKNFFKKQILGVAFLLMSVSVLAQVPAYYNGTDITKTGQELKTNLAVLIQQGTTGSYTPGVWDALRQTDLDPTNPNNVLLIYGYSDADGNPTTDRTRDKNSNGGNNGTDWNREHTYPRSLGSPNLGSSGPGSDVHHLRSSDVQMNSNRGNRPYIDVAGGGNARAFNSGWYPGDEWKGDVARMMMYMYLRYGNQCRMTTVGIGSATFNAEIPDMFLQWNAEDPVSQYEINRNVIVEGIQGNRNPFIDNPAFATSIWGGPQAEDRFNSSTTPDDEVPTAPTNLVASNIKTAEVTLSWNAATDNIGVIAYQVFQDGNQVTAVTSTNYTVTGLTENTTYSFSVRAVDAAGNVSANSNAISVTTLEDTVITPPTDGDFIAFQGFETDDTWSYTLSPVPCTQGTDVWDIVSSLGPISTPKAGSNFFGVRDLDGNCGSSAGGTISFDAVDVSAFDDVQLSFSVNVSGFDVSNGDTIAYQTVFDGQPQAEETITVGSPYTTNGWEAVTVSVPNTVNTVALVISVKQNGGSDYAGFDNISLVGTSAAAKPAAPTNVSASNITTSEVTLSWDASTSNVASYNVFQNDTQINSVAGTNYTVTGLTENTTYSFKVVAVDAAGNTSDDSNVVSVTTLEDVVTPPTGGDFIVFQGFETGDSWNYTVSPVACNDGGSDVWDVVSSVGSISSAKTDANFFGVRDLEGNCGTSAGGTISFDTVDVTSFESVQLSFGVNVVGYDVSNGDTISYQTVFDGQSQAEQVITVGSPYSTNGWETITVNVPDTVSAVGLVISVKQNGGSDYAGFDDVNVTGTPIATTPNVLINELDADTAGTDTQEFVELFDGGTGNTSLDGLVLVFYNGSNNQSYRTIDLSGQTTNAEGYFVVGNQDVPNVNIVIPSNGLQNGADAVALFSGNVADYPNGSAVSTDNLVDAVVYDTNDGDDAELLVLLNAGEPQLNEGELGDKDGHSLQRTPNGAGGARNTSSFSQLTPTPGTENGVVVVPLPNILINELDADTAGTDTQEFVELYDGGTGNTSLDGLVLVFYNGSNNESYNAIDLSGQTTNAEGYFVVGNQDVPNVNIVIPSNGLQNGADAVALYLGNVADYANGSAVSTDNLLDAVVYDTNDGDDVELLVLLNAGEPQLNEDELDNKDGHSLQRLPNGAGGARNTSSFTQFASTPGAANEKPVVIPTDLVINEIDVDTSGTDTQEFIELYDGGTGNTSLGGLVLVFYNGSNDASYNAIDLSGNTTNAEGYFVVGNQEVPNVNLVVSNNALQNGADAVGLYVANVSDFANGTSVTTTNLVDAVVYDTNDDDDAGLLVLLNAGEPQLNEDELGDKDIHSLQRSPNGLGGQRNTSSFTVLRPTPGAENADVVTEPTEIISIAEARNKVEGEKVIITGVLTVSDQFRGSAYLQDATGAIAIFDEQVYGENVFQIGDSITVKGRRSAFNDQVQLQNITEVVNNGLPNRPITPKEITLSELGNHPGELVKVLNPNFPRPTDIFFGNANYELTDASGNGQLRIDLDVTEIVGLAQPSSCDEVIGVVGRFLETYQLLPRQRSDISCANEYTLPPFPINDVSKENTLDIVTWNIEWFGDEENSPATGNENSDQIQKEGVKTVIEGLDADVIAVQEIVDVPLFTELINELPAYDFILSDAVSRPTSNDGATQKVGFIYKKSTVNVKKTEALLRSIHPLYNGGDDSALEGYPADKNRFFATGRLPFLMTADVTVNGETEEYNFVALHARANRGTDAQARYDMRKYDVEVLKDSLDTRFATDNLVLLGDYNDDVDETVVASSVSNSASTYDLYVRDTVNYNIVTTSLTNRGYRSFVSSENMIDHIAISNELEDNYLQNSEIVHYEFYNNTYPRTTSDHFPVSVRLQLKELEIGELIVSDVSCNGSNDGAASVLAFNGVAPYTYTWSNGATSETVTDLAVGTYYVTVTDAVGVTITKDFVIQEPTKMEVSVSENATVYNYGDESCTDIEVLSVSGGQAPYSYEWSNGATSETIQVCPEESTTYTVVVTDANGCSVSKEVTVEVENIICGGVGFFKTVQMCFRGREKCVPEFLVRHYLRKGATLGSCGDGNANVFEISRMRVYPNPFVRNLKVSFESTGEGTAVVSLYSIFGGRKVFSEEVEVVEGVNKYHYNLGNLRRGVYFMKIFVDGKKQQVKLLIKK